MVSFFQSQLEMEEFDPMLKSYGISSAAHLIDARMDDEGTAALAFQSILLNGATVSSILTKIASSKYDTFMSDDGGDKGTSSAAAAAALLASNSTSGGIATSDKTRASTITAQHSHSSSSIATTASISSSGSSKPLEKRVSSKQKAPGIFNIFSRSTKV